MASRVAMAAPRAGQVWRKRKQERRVKEVLHQLDIWGGAVSFRVVIHGRRRAMTQECWEKWVENAELVADESDLARKESQ